MKAAKDIGRSVAAEPENGVKLVEIASASGKTSLSANAGGLDFDAVGMEADKDTFQCKIAELNTEYFVAPEGGKTRIWREGLDPELGHQTLVPMTKEDFKLLLANKFVSVPVDDKGNTRSSPLSGVWLTSPARREFPTGIGLWPDGNVPRGAYNMWRGFNVEPVQGDPAPMLHHIEKVLCDGNMVATQYVVNWCARSVQKPDKVAEVAVVMRGGKGTGKGTLGRAMKHIFGAHGLQISQTRHLTGNFNAHLRGLLYLFSDEAYFAGDKAGEGALKALVTEDTIAIEGKGRDVVAVRNRLKIMMASNNEWVVPAGVDERRFLVLDVSNCHRQDKEYFDYLNNWMDNENGLGIWLNHLLQLDISDFDIRQVPATAALEAQKLLSLPPLQAWVYSQLYQGELPVRPSALVAGANYPITVAGWLCEQSKDGILAAFAEYVKAEGLRHVHTDATSVGKQLHDIFPTLTSARRGEGGRRRVWVFPDLETARADFARYANLKHAEWPEDEEERA